jgi:hypothetical protein
MRCIAVRLDHWEDEDALDVCLDDDAEVIGPSSDGD